MIIYILIILLLIYLVDRYDIHESKLAKERWFKFVLVIFILLAGFRYRIGLDTTRYAYHFYHTYPDLSDYTIDDFIFGNDILYKLLNSLVRALGGKFYVVQLIQSAFVNTLVFYYLKRHSKYLFTCILLYFIWQYYGYNAEEMRAGMSIVICLFANDYILEKKWALGIFLYMVGCFFHSSTLIILLLCPILKYLKFNIKGSILLIALFIASSALRPLIESFYSLFAFNATLYGKMDNYIDDAYYMQSGLNILGLITSFALLAYPVYSLYIVKKKDNCNSVLRLEPLLFMYIMFAIINLSIPIAYRFLHFYSVYFILFISELIVRVLKSGKNKLVTFFFVVVPLIVLMEMPFFSKDMSQRFIPYSSVFDKTVNPDREHVYRTHDAGDASYNEY